MTKRTYYSPPGGLPPQTQLATDRATFTEAYAIIPKIALSDVTVSYLPFWEGTRFWILSKPMSGFAETFSQYIGEVEPGGGSENPDAQNGVEAVLFIVKGDLTLTIDGITNTMEEGGYAYLPPGVTWTLHNKSANTAQFHWIRKIYQAVDGVPLPDPIVANEMDFEPEPMPDTNGAWATTRFVDQADLRHDMHVTVVTIQPGGVIPFPETHIMEHGIYILEGKGVYRLNQDWVEVEAGDYVWLRAFCPQACYAGGPNPFRYLLYKDVNRQASM